MFAKLVTIPSVCELPIFFVWVYAFQGDFPLFLSIFVFYYDSVEFILIFCYIYMLEQYNALYVRDEHGTFATSSHNARIST